MAYRELPRPTRDGDVADDAVREFLLDVGRRKEFRALAPRAEDAELAPPRAPHPFGAGLVREGDEEPLIEGLRLHGAQLFVRNFFSPDTPYPRLLLNWQTGAGKTLGAISIAQEFVGRFRAMAGVPPRERPTVFVVGFSKAIIQAEMLRHPDFVAPEEKTEMARLHAIAKSSGSATSPEARKYNGYVSVLKRRITDRSRGGYYRFMGYKEFGNQLFGVTRKGIAAGFKVAALYSRGPAEAADDTGGTAFIARIEKAEREGLVRVDEGLVASMRGGLLVADEIHNTYNVQAKNNYGIAIQYVLDRLGAAAPRAVFMSATVVGGNPMEIVDLLNFLVPAAELGGRRLERRDFFRTREGADGRRVPEPLPGALARIGRLSAGRVSYLLDAGADPESYPERIFEGEPLAGPGGEPIPYLRFTPCPMSPLHARTLARLKAEREEGFAGAKKRLAIAAGSYAIYDIAYPNPEFPPGKQEYGLYKSDTAAVLSAAPDKWKKAVGVDVLPFAGSAALPVIGGPFLKAPAVGAYSAKYARLAAEVVAAVKGGPGKIFIYHHRVRLSGALQVARLLSENGFVDATSLPRPTTMCAVCGVARRDHGKQSGKRGHAYAPARYLVVVSELDPSTVQRNLALYNAPGNVRGHEYRALIGSAMIREGHDLKEIRFGYVLSLPVDISLLIQVLGRMVRKFSHARLPPAERDVRVRILVSAASEPGGDAPEVARYAEKMREYLLSQRVNAEIWRHAFDAFVNYEKVRRQNPALVETASLDTIPYEPAVGYAAATRGPAAVDTFEAYGYGAREVAAIRAVLVALFDHQAVWTYDDLWTTVRTTRTKGLSVNPATFAEESFALALEALCEGGAAGDGPVAYARAGAYYVRVPVGSGGHPVVDVESYVRDVPALAPVRVRVAEYVEARRTTANYGTRLAAFEAAFAGARPVEDIFLEFDAGFLTRLAETLVTSPAARAGRLAGAMKRAYDLFARLRVFVTGDDLDCPDARRFVRGARTLRAGSRAVGYVAPAAVRVHGADGWYDIPFRALGLEPRHSENDVVVGYVESRGGRLRFKVRPPLHVIAAADVRDARSIARGAVCATRPRADQVATARALGVFGRGAVAPAASSAKLCRAIYRELLRREEAARRTKAGRRSGERWFYLFNEALPAPGHAR